MIYVVISILGLISCAIVDIAFTMRRIDKQLKIRDPLYVAPVPKINRAHPNKVKIRPTTLTDDELAERERLEGI